MKDFMDTYISELEYLINIDSGVGCFDGSREIASFFAEKFRDMGWQVTEHDFEPETGTCMIATNREAEHYDLMMIGHTDTVFPKGEAKERPFYIEDGKAYGPGASDMKHGCLLMYYILKNLPKETLDALNIVVVFNPDEEVGSLWSRTVYKEYAEKCDYAFIYEGKGTAGGHCTERKGACGLEVEFFGVAGHCGYILSRGLKSAVSEMAKWLVKLDTLMSEERGTTVNSIVEEGGEKSNVVPDYALMKSSIRFIHKEEIERIESLLAQLEKEAESRGIQVKIHKRFKEPLVPTEEGKAYIAHVEKLFKEQGLEFNHALRGGLSDANVIATYGPICIDGLGPMGGGSHTKHEYLTIDSVMPAFQTSNILIEDLAKNKKGFN